MQIRGLATVWPEPIWIKVSGWWQIPSQHQSTYLGGPESASIEIPPFRPHFIKFQKNIFIFQEQKKFVQGTTFVRFFMYSKPKISEWSENFWKFLFLKIYFIKKVWKGGFQLMLILGLLGMYFDAAVVFVTSQTLFLRLALAILCELKKNCFWNCCQRN